MSPTKIEIWLKIFNSLCLLHSNGPALSNAIETATNEVFTNLIENENVWE